MIPIQELPLGTAKHPLKFSRIAAIAADRGRSHLQFRKTFLLRSGCNGLAQELVIDFTLHAAGCRDRILGFGSFDQRLGLPPLNPLL